MVSVYLFSKKPVTTSQQVSRLSPTPKVQGEKSISIPDLLGEFPKNASESERFAFRQRVQDLAKTTPTITIKDCQPTPQIVLVSGTKNIMIVYKDEADHTLIFNPDNSLIIKSQETQELLSTFTSGYGLHSFRCDNSLPVGIIYTTP